MELKKTISNNEVNILVNGRIDTTNADEFERLITSDIAENVKVIVDFSNIAYISSAGLRALLSAHKLATKFNGKFAITKVNDEVMEVFDITGFSSILNIEG